MVHPWYLDKTLFGFSSVKRQHDRSQKVIHEFIDEIIESETIKLNQNERVREANTKIHDEDTGRKNKTIIELLLQNPHGMSYQQIREEIITILIGKYVLLIFSHIDYPHIVW